ncbi:hypothetical protein B5X24_HaOG202295 [Helicoverpa armigera]|uniref:Uncharacterized protein n=1 Tax=Helicoverpa armigera TaxID=29058 RepID=A0A2W1BZK2_HELAM|nr:hypothetical protein B5X24_HaOG202295 [Helicoverpa armigera]
MPGYGLSQVKCEPLSDEEDSDSQFAHSYLSSQSTSLLDRHMEFMNVSEVPDSADFMPLLAVKDEPSSEGGMYH